MYINSALGKIFEDIFDTDNVINTGQLKAEEKSDLSEQLIFNKNINNDQDLDETNNIIWNAINIANTPCSISIPGTLSLTDLPVPPCSRSLLDTS